MQLQKKTLYRYFFATFANLWITSKFFLSSISWSLKTWRELFGNLYFCWKTLWLTELHFKSPFFDQRVQKVTRKWNEKTALKLSELLSSKIKNYAQSNHTIRKVKFLYKNSILTKTPTFSRVFHPIFFDNFSREIKVVNS